jgi:hypothetical protein
MYRKSFIASTFAILTALSSLQSYAQEEQMSLQFITFPNTIEPLKVELLLSEGRTVELLVPSNELGPVVRVPRMATLVLGEKIINKEQEPEFKIYGQGKSTSAPKQLVLLLRKGKDMASGFDVRAISSDTSDFSGGKLLFVNAAKIDIAGDVGKNTFALKPGTHKIIKPKLEANGRLAEAKFWYNKDGEAVPFFNSMWPVSDQFRGLIFFYHDPNNNHKIQIHSFRDFIAEE